MTVDGAGSALTVNELYAGYEGGSGTVRVTNGGRIAANEAINLGQQALGSTPLTGILTVDGVGSTVVSNTLTVGVHQQGSLTASGGATIVTNTLAEIGRNPSSSSSASITGAGTTWTVGAPQLSVGLGGSGVLAVSDQAHVTAPVVVLADQAGSAGELQLNSAGVLTTNGVSKGLGTGTVKFDGGVLQVAGNQTNLFQGFAPGNVQLLAGGGTIDTQAFFVANDLALQGAGGLTKAGSGELILTGDNSYTGGTTIAAGTLQLGNGGTTGSIVGNVVNNGTLVVTHSGARQQ